jgi:hypothetical protein
MPRSRVQREDGPTIEWLHGRLDREDWREFGLRCGLFSGEYCPIGRVEPHDNGGLPGIVAIDLKGASIT